MNRLLHFGCFRLIVLISREECARLTVELEQAQRVQAEVRHALEGEHSKTKKDLAEKEAELAKVYKKLESLMVLCAPFLSPFFVSLNSFPAGGA